jgi:hypothetical protein
MNTPCALRVFADHQLDIDDAGYGSYRAPAPLESSNGVSSGLRSEFPHTFFGRSRCAQRRHFPEITLLPRYFA